MHIQPDEGISLRFEAKVPGPDDARSARCEMDFHYEDYFGRQAAAPATRRCSTTA